MRKTLFLLPFAALLCTTIQAQNGQAAKDAFMITRMVEKFHIQPKTLNDGLSANIYKQLLHQLDEDKIFFTQEDIKTLSAFEFKLDDEIKGRKEAFLQTLVSIYKKRLLQADTIISEITAKPFNFSLPEKYTVAEDTSWPVNETGMRTKLNKVFKASGINVLVDKDFVALSAVQQKKYMDKVEPLARQKLKKSFSRSITMMLQGPGGVQAVVGKEYCKAIAKCYDPHTEFLPTAEKENFESELGQKSMAFGFMLDEAEDGTVVINDIEPGSPAFKSGQINKGDKIESIQWEGKEPIDLSEAAPEELGRSLSLSNHDKAVFKVKKADGTIREVTLWKETVEDTQDNNKVKSFLLKGSKTFGYLSLPAFYEDWENGSGVNGCANDVAKEIVKLKKENIAGLILDIRYNGGGSMQEAVELAGIFIDAGPVGQYKAKDAQVITVKDANRGTIYDGPLMVLVNGYSASASEVIAGTLQDYNRAVIVGSPTYGKATAQVILPMDTTITLDTDVSSIKTSNYIKITVSQLYRITGKTAQATGVIPDVLLPDVLDAQNNKEVDEPFALQSKVIDANKYYKALPPLPIKTINAIAINKINEVPYFNSVKEYIQKEKKTQQKKDIDLKITNATLTTAVANREAPSLKDANTDTTLFSIQTHSFENQRLQSNKRLQEMDQQWKKFLAKDPYVKLAYELMLSMIK